MSKLTKIHRYAIMWLHSQGSSNAEIANELDLTEKQIFSAINKFSMPSNDAIPTTSSPVGRPSSKDLMITQSASKTRNVSIMTGEASAKNDELKKNTISKNNKQDGIFRPFQK